MKTWKHGDRQFQIRQDTLDASILRETYIDRDYDIVTFRANDRWLDIGAHIGAFSVLASAQVQSVDAYEPDQDNYGLLCFNIALNGCHNVKAHRSAIAEHAGPTYLWKHPGRNTAAHTLIRRDDFYPVAVFAVDINEALRGIDCVKLDAEGAEWEIVRAVDSWREVRQVVIEYHHLLNADYGGFLDMLRGEFGLTEYPVNERIKCNHIVGVRR